MKRVTQEQMGDMQQENLAERNQIEQTLRAVTEYSDTLFDRAPVMMHSINRNGELVKVNRRWLTTLGYNQDEVLGQKAVDFLTDESRLVAIRDILPLFWQARSDRSIGFQFLRKNGRVLNILMDAEAVPGPNGELSTGLATLRTRRSLTQWLQASTTLRNIRDITQIQHQLEILLSANGPEFRNRDTGALEPLGHRGWLERATGTQPEPVDMVHEVLESVPTMSHSREGQTEEALNVLVEASRDVAANLRALVREQEDWREGISEQHSELLLVIKSIDKTLAQLADAVSAQD